MNNTIVSNQVTTNKKPMLQFNKNASQYEIRRKFTYPESLFIKLAQACSKHDLALDIGCGNGVSSDRLTKYFRHVHASDIGDNLIANAKINYPTINFSVSSAENFINSNKYDLITSACSFYWMDRKQVLSNIKTMLVKDGVFCAYKYDTPIIYGPIRDLINYEFATKWAKYRDSRLLEYDNTIELIEETKIFNHVEQFIEPNLLDLTPEEIALVFLSTSYVTSYIENTGDQDYPLWLVEQCKQLHQNKPERVKVRSDIYGYMAVGLK